LLFKGLKFFLSTEVPRYSLEYIILACGGEVELSNNDSSITHVITDRDNIKPEKTKEYVQPQWVYDSLNFNKLLGVKEYAVGKVFLSLFRPCHPICRPSLTKTTRKGMCLIVRES
jgi:pescadillo